MQKIAIILAVIFLFCNQAHSQPKTIKGESGDLQDQIIIYNLVSGLSLDKNQMQFILSEARYIKGIKDNLDKEIKQAQLGQKQDLLLLKEEAKKDIPQVNRDLAKKIHEQSESIKKLHADYIRVIKSSSNNLKKKLTDKQLYVIDNFKPCLVPPKGAARVGQAQNNDNVIRIFEKIRDMPAHRFYMNKEKIANRFADKIILKQPYLDDEEIIQIKKEAFKIVEELRELSYADFVVKKYEKAEELKNLVKEDKKVNLDKKIARFLLHPQTIVVLEDKLYN